MKNSNQFKIIETSRELSEQEQSDCKELLKGVLQQKGIISLCLDNKSLFVEYNSEELDTEKIYDILDEAGFPVAFEISMAS